MNKRNIRKLQEAGVKTLFQLHALYELVEHPEGLRMTKLAQNIGISTAGMTQIADNFEKAWLAERLTPKGTDRRVTILKLTTKGHVYARIGRTPDE